MNAIRKILITGGCGFIGSNLIAGLMSRSDAPDIRVLDNESLGKKAHIAEFDVDFIRGDVRDLNVVTGALRGVDAVIHLAADTRVVESIANPVHNFEVNVVGTFNLLSAMRETNVTRIINASTGGAIIGDAIPPVNEGMVPAPLSPYGASKLAAEGYCSTFSHAYGFQATSVRFSNVYGPRSYHKGSVVSAFLKNILRTESLVVYGDGEQTRDYVFVEDLCTGITKALESGKSGVFQLGTGLPTSINALIDNMLQITGSNYPVHVNYEPYRDGEIKQTWCDITKARRELGYNPQTTVLAGLQKTWEWFLSLNGEQTSRENNA
ncbi:MAG: GDP-mannose 4,6-dehydratase [Parvibaculum sp.]|nr:GDP-mannose 4,6-dehydratase [Parvibaculum sp.]